MNEQFLKNELLRALSEAHAAAVMLDDDEMTGKIQPLLIKAVQNGGKS